jgi:hypothetical protein
MLICTKRCILEVLAQFREFWKVNRDFSNVEMTPVISRMWKPEHVRRFWKPFWIPTRLSVNHHKGRCNHHAWWLKHNLNYLFIFPHFIFIFIFIFILFSYYFYYYYYYYYFLFFSFSLLTLQEEDNHFNPCSLADLLTSWDLKIQFVP